MKRLIRFILFCTSSLFALEPELTFENSNFILSAPLNSTKESTVYDYNRFRTTVSLHVDNWFFTSIGDIDNYLGKEKIESTSYRASRSLQADTPFSTQTGITNYEEGEYSAKLYRFYGGYVDAKHRVSFGLQKISMGVGRIWNPTDLFNAKNPLSLEPDEVYGVYSLAYTYALSDLSHVTAVVAQEKNDTFKYAGRIKGYVDVADVALNVITSSDATMLGYEIEGEFLDTGVTLRSEGGFFEEKRVEKKFFQGLVGVDYTFENSLSLAAEWLYSTKNFEDETVRARSKIPNNLMRSKGYAGLSVGYEFDALLYGSLVGIVNADDSSFYFSPAMSYSLKDDMTLKFGVILYDGKKGSEFSGIAPTYYVNLKVTF